MEVIFKACDGALFNNVMDCVAHEKELHETEEPTWQGWDWDGKLTKHTDEAVFLHLSEYDSAESFLRSAAAYNDDKTGGILPGDTGWFYWEEGEERYRLIDDCLIYVIQKASAS